MKIKLYILIAFITLTLTACTTKTIYVPVRCPKAPPLVPPHNYFSELKLKPSAPEFVKACLSTTLSVYQAYDSCASKMETYQ